MSATDTTCWCGHPRADHQHGTGRCSGRCVDSATGYYTCVCPYYTEERL